MARRVIRHAEVRHAELETTPFRSDSVVSLLDPGLLTGRTYDHWLEATSALTISSGGPLVVRSSSLAEDSATESNAGRYVSVVDVAHSVGRKYAGFGASEGSCNPVKISCPELSIEGGILRTQAGQLDAQVCAVTCRGERDLNQCRRWRRFVSSLTVPCNHHAVRGIDFYVAAGDHRPFEVKGGTRPLAEKPS